jgi:hypothetical protein
MSLSLKGDPFVSHLLNISDENLIKNIILTNNDQYLNKYLIFRIFFVATSKSLWYIN